MREGDVHLILGTMIRGFIYDSIYVCVRARDMIYANRYES